MGSPPKLRSPEIHHLAVVTADLGRSEAFYVDVLGLPVRARHDDDRGVARAVWLGLEGGAFLALERAAKEEPKRDDAAPGLHCMALAIRRVDRDAWRTWVTLHGYAPVRESAFTLYLRDPDANLIGLSHFPEP